MPRIVGVATASPPYVLTQEKVKSFATRVFGERRGLDHLFTVFDHTDIQERHSTTIFFILKRFLETTRNQTKRLGLLSTLGPGFSSELVLLEWT